MKQVHCQQSLEWPMEPGWIHHDYHYLCQIAINGGKAQGNAKDSQSRAVLNDHLQLSRFSVLFGRKV
jgi:hypothetical protein